MKKLITLFFALVIFSSAGFGQTCDTVLNLRSPLDTAQLDYINNETGYLAGNNGYGDLIKAEGFPAVVGDYVNSVLLFFAVVTINPADTNKTVTIAVWDNNGTSAYGIPGAPGNILDTVKVTLGQIAQNVTSSNQNPLGITGLIVNFTGGVPIPTDTFYVGVILPTTEGDTVVLYVNTIPPGPDGNGWDYYEVSPGYYGWGSYNDDWTFTGGSAGNYIDVFICNAPPSGGPVASFTSVSTSSNSSNNCLADTVTFTDHTIPIPLSWTWFFGDGTTSNAQNPTHIYTTGGTYTVTESVTNNPGLAIQVYVPATDTIHSNAAPAVAVSITGASSSSSTDGGATIDVTNGNGPFNYAWSSNNGSGNTLTDVAPGNYTVTVTDYNLCTVSAPVVIGISTGINAVSDEPGITIFPNPAGNQLNFQWSVNHQADAVIYDVTGRVVGSYTVEGKALNHFDITGLAPGPYIIRITDRQTKLQHTTMFTKL